MAVDAEQQAGWVTTGNPSTVNDSTPFAPGQLGTYLSTLSNIAIPSQANPIPTGIYPRIWQYVQLDSSSATPAFGQFLVWEDHTSYQVTTVSSTTKRNNGAGALQNASVTLGNYTWILVGGVGAALTEAGQTPAAGDVCIGGATTAGRFGVTAQGTAPLCQNLGTFLGAKTVAFSTSSALPTDTCAVLFNFPRLAV